MHISEGKIPLNYCYGISNQTSLKRTKFGVIFEKSILGVSLKGLPSESMFWVLPSPIQRYIKIWNLKIKVIELYAWFLGSEEPSMGKVLAIDILSQKRLNTINSYEFLRIFF